MTSSMLKWLLESVVQTDAQFKGGIIMSDTTGAGHGGKNNFDMGAGGGGRLERTEVVKINNYFRQWNPGWLDVGDTLATNVNQNLINIVANTNRLGKSWERTLSHHLNAFNGKATGAEVWYYAGDEVMRQKAARISSIIAKTLGIVDRGPKATTSLYVVAYTNPHCLLIEWYFVDNPNDRAAWDRNGTAAMNAVMKELGMKTPTNGGGKLVPSKPKKPNHVVVAGWFTKGSAAHKECVKWFKDNKLNCHERFVKDRVFILSYYPQDHTNKRKFTSWLESKYWTYAVVLEGQQNSIIDNWDTHL